MVQLCEHSLRQLSRIQKLFYHRKHLIFSQASAYLEICLWELVLERTLSIKGATPS